MTKALTRSILQSHPRNSAVKWGAVELVERDIHVVQDSGDGSMGAMHETRGRCSGLRGKRLLQEAVRLKETLSINCELSEKSLLILAKRIRQAAPVMPDGRAGSRPCGLDAIRKCSEAWAAGSSNPSSRTCKNCVSKA